MKKKIHIKLIGEDNIDDYFDAIVTDNKIKYQENSINVVITMFKDEIHMKRNCNEYTIDLSFKKGKTISTYQVFGSPKVFELETITKQLIINKDKILIDYNLEGNDISFRLEM